VRKIRVLVANWPRLMRELVLATLADQPDVDVVGETDKESEIMDLVEQTRPDFVIIGLEDQERRPALCGFLLGRRPEIKILAVSPERNSTVCYWASVDIRSRPIETSEEGLLGALRSGMEDRRVVMSDVR
jgi:chemotaxis response regulator CheB